MALLSSGGAVEITWDSPRPHSERLLPALDQLLALASLRLADVAGFAISIGPGSFTGLRVGLATLKGLAFADSRPIAAVPTLAARAATAEGVPGPVAALLDARRGEVYAACFSAPGALAADVLDESVYRPEALAAQLPQQSALVLDAGAADFARRLCHLRPDLRPLPLPLGRPRAACVAQLGRRILATPAAALSADSLHPRYLRRPAAEALRTGHPLEP